jgi:antitoxin component of MazEF toxin-antitoxin module
MATPTPRKVVMTRRLSRIGNSQGLIIPMNVLDLLGISMETDLEIVTDGQALFVFPTNHPEIKKVRALAKADLSNFAIGEDK